MYSVLSFVFSLVSIIFGATTFTLTTLSIKTLDVTALA
jgi:hypothetical protein